MFSQVFQTHVSSVSSVFFCMLQVLHLNVSKVDRGVVHEMRVGRERGCEQSPRAVWRRGLAAGAGTRKFDAVGALARSLRGHRRTLASWIGCPDARKSDSIIAFILDLRVTTTQRNLL